MNIQRLFLTATVAFISTLVLYAEAPEKSIYEYRLDTAAAPDLAEWTDKELRPAVIEWYPKIVSLLRSDGFSAPTNVVLEYRSDMGGIPAYAAGGTISMNAPWFRTQLKGEAKGCVIHELVHIAQQYGRAKVKDSKPTPGWVTEGIADYIRWFLYEPQSKGAEITHGNFARANYNSNYRITANFLNWVIVNKDKDFLPKLNTVAREGTYSDDVWKNATTKTAEELGSEWKSANAKRLGL